MILQNIIFPSPETCTVEEMYFRRNGFVEYTWADRMIRLHQNAAVYFDTYFNSFSIGKWGKYAKIKHVYVTFKLKGKVRITLVRKERVGKEILSHYLHESIMEASGGEVTIKFEETDYTGILSADIFALEESIIYGGYYSTDIEEREVREVKLALDICTFKRERFVIKNMNILNNRIYQTADYEALQKHLAVFIIDNAGTLPISELSRDDIHVIKNKNVGGAGGFTRGLMEIRRLQEKEGYTHALLMDDDVVIEPEAIFRTWALLSVLKEEFEEAFVGGAMLRLDRQYIQVESGAYWNQGNLISRKSGLDLRGIEPCLYNEIEEKIDYSAWWYCTIPLQVVRDDNLPLPIFIRGDDVEYGLRNTKKIIMMNGLCVWHEPFENKYSSSMFYYILRNRLIDNAVHDTVLDKKEFIHIMKSQVMIELYLYRYKNVRLLLQGVLDFYRGIDWLKAQDGEALHRKVLEDGYRLQYVEDVDAIFDYGAYERALLEPENASTVHRLIRKLTINGTLLKPKREHVVTPVTEGRHINVYRAESVMNYDKTSQKGFAVKRNAREARACLKMLKEAVKETNRSYDKVSREYKERCRELMNREFWEKYLYMVE